MSGSQQRVESISNHFVSSQDQPKAVLHEKNGDQVVITLAVRTPLTKAGKGALKDTPLEDIVTETLKALRNRSNIDPALVEDVCLGNVLHPAASYVARSSVLAAGFPVTTAAYVVSRWCSSGLMSVQAIANQIQVGAIDCGIAIGAESMSTTPDGGAPNFSDKVMKSSEKVRDAAMPMGWTSENVAADFNINREKQDEFAAWSQQKASHAQSEGWTQDEMFSFETTWIDPKTQEQKSIVADRDDGVRSGTTPEVLGKLRAAFPDWAPSTTTGGNASQITDGAAGILLMRRSMAERLGQPILARFIGATAVAIEPRIMGISPTVAIPKLLTKYHLTKDDVDIFEINEAFSSMGVYCLETLGLDRQKLNPRGGAIALGHPLGCTGARQIVTALSELRRTGKKVAVTSMCVGTGMGMAALIISEM
ncbi:3-ketoacyl-CoA thiolase [Acrodontium crateriforme]|uniref:acetyl-CoA C-acyltransferase n=1 Tax=Acrodontium crateriforme TaxID=150365 RepID=A0AAQ3RA03_9PEZI|nr:3-ketoacyl-CoA thiolase [Acrodontium crateriforme]